MTHFFPLVSFGGMQGVAPQISVAYSWMVRSLENLPTVAMFLTTILSHLVWSCSYGGKHHYTYTLVMLKYRGIGCGLQSCLAYYYIKKKYIES